MVSVCIVVPIYKTSPSSSELASFRQVLKVLAKYDLFSCSIHNQLLLNNLQVISQKYGRNL